MKKTLIRRNTFETNSSSAHSFSLGGNEKPMILDTIYPNDQGKIILNAEQFGWQWFKHNDSETKAVYALITFYDTDRYEEVVDLIKVHTGADEVVFNFSSDYNSDDWGYIDHESSDMIYGLSNEQLKDFIFNKNSWLFGGNDNQNAPIGFKQVETFFEDGSVEKFKFTHRVCIPDLDIVENACIMKTEYTWDENSEDYIIDSLLQDIVLMPKNQTPAGIYFPDYGLTLNKTLKDYYIVGRIYYGGNQHDLPLFEYRGRADTITKKVAFHHISERSGDNNTIEFDYYVKNIG